MLRKLIDKPYTGIGSRKTPGHILTLMLQLGETLHDREWILRSGGAIGADLAFERRVSDNKEIYRPINDRNTLPHHITKYDPTTWLKARDIAMLHHPAWHRCSPYAQALHTRNVFELLGKNLDLPSRFVICYTLNGQDSGGTGLTMRVADTYNIPIFNLYYPDIIERVTKLLESNDETW